MVYSFARVVITKYHRLDGLNSEIQFLTVLENIIPRPSCELFQHLLRPFSLACNWQSGCVLMWSFIYACASLCVQIPSYKGTSQIGLGPTKMTLF